MIDILFCNKCDAETEQTVIRETDRATHVCHACGCVEIYEIEPLKTPEQAQPF